MSGLYVEFGGDSSPLLRDVHGSPEFKQELEEVVMNMERQSLFEIVGIQPEKVFLFAGPPGTGKTYSTAAIKNELSARGSKVIYMPYSIGSYGSCYINMGAKNIQTFFNTGRMLLKKFNNEPRVLYWFDEADVLLRPRGEFGGHKEDDKLLDALMTNLNDIHTVRNNEYVIMASNFEEGIDSAAVRAGRVDRTIMFPLPDYDALVTAYKYSINKINKAAKYNVISCNSPEKLATMSEGLNYADVESIIQKSVRQAIYNIDFHNDEGVIPPPKVRQSHIEKVIAKYAPQRTEERKIGFR
jgi:SpoVK/Ycf46/Vps4 family AAA+-type ATPase